MKTRLARSPLALGALAALVANAGVALAAAGLHVAMARLLSVEAFGLFVTATTWVLLLTTVAVFGMDSVAVRFTAIHQTARDWARDAGLRRTLAVLVLLSGGLTAALGGVLSWGLAAGGWVGPQADAAFRLALFSLPMAAGAMVVQGLLRGRRRPALAVMPLGLVRPAVTVAGTAAWLGWLRGGDALTVALWAWVAGSAVALTLAFWAWRRTAGAPVPNPLYDRATWLGAAAGLGVIAVGQTANSQLDVLALGAFAGTDAAGLYSAAARLAQLVSFGLVAVNAMAGPLLAAAHAEGDRARMRGLLRGSVWGGAALAAPLALLGLALPETCLALFGPAFGAAAPALTVLVLAQLVNVAAGPGALLVGMTGHHRAGAFALLAGLGANLGLALALVPRWGPLGAALATLGGMCVWNGWLVAHAWRRLRLDPTLLGRAL